MPSRTKEAEPELLESSVRSWSRDAEWDTGWLTRAMRESDG